MAWSPIRLRALTPTEALAQGPRSSRKQSRCAPCSPREVTDQGESETASGLQKQGTERWVGPVQAGDSEGPGDTARGDSPKVPGQSPGLGLSEGKQVSAGAGAAAREDFEGLSPLQGDIARHRAVAEASVPRGWSRTVQPEGRGAGQSSWVLGGGQN